MAPGWILGFPPRVIIGAQAQKPTKSGLITGGWSLDLMTKNERKTQIKTKTRENPANRRDLLLGKKNAANQCHAVETENQIRATS